MPNHGDSTPSLTITVRPDTLSRKPTLYMQCKGCHVNGSAICKELGLLAQLVFHRGNDAYLSAKPKFIEAISEAKVLSYIKELKGRPTEMAYLLEKRGLTEAVVNAYRIGYDDGRDRFTLPVYDADGELRNIRRYLPDASPGDKMRNAPGHGSPARLYPRPPGRRGRRPVVVCEGEWDALVLRRHGFLSFTSTHGKGSWEPEWPRLFVGRTVAFIYDVGAEREAADHGRSLVGVARSVRVVKLPLPTEGDDVTDWFVRESRTADDLRQLIAAAPVAWRSPLGVR
jgi:DNA primase